MAKTDQRLIVILEQLPFCSLCYQDLTQIPVPYQPPCKHLFCSSCAHQTQGSFFTCPLDDMRAPWNLVTENERLCAMAREFVDVLDGIEADAPNEDTLSALRELGACMRREVRTDLVTCRRGVCGYYDCPYAHKSPKAKLPPTAAPLAGSIVIPQVSDYFAIPEPKLIDFDIVEAVTDEDRSDFDEIREDLSASELS